MGPTVFFFLYQLYHIFSPLPNWFICLCECLNFCFIPCETDTHGNSWKSSADEKCNAPMAMLRLSGSAFVPVTHCHHSHRDFPDPPSLSKLLSGAVHSYLLGFDYIWVVTAFQSKMHWIPRADLQLAVLKAFPLLEPANKQEQDQTFCRWSQNFSL